MRLEQLEYVAAVVRHGSLRRAADALHVSQPALSEGIGKLERELGVSLLDRHRSGARISEHGQQLLPSITGVLESADQLRHDAGDQRASGRTLRLGTVTAASQVVAPAVADFKRQQPRTPVEVRDLQQREIRDGLVAGTLDLGLVNLLADDPATVELESTPLLAGRPVVVLRADHRLTARPELTVAELLDEPFIAMRPGYAMQRLTGRLFGPAGPSPTYIVDGASSGQLMAAQGLGFTVLPDYSVLGDPLHESGLLTHRPLVGIEAVVTLVLWRRRRRAADRNALALATALLRRCRDTGRAIGSDGEGPAARRSLSPTAEAEPA